MSNATTASRRARTMLTIAILVLFALLIGLVVLFFNLLKPAGLPDEAGVDTEMTWVRSLYGFGPSAEEQLLSPSSVAIAPNGDIYVTDPIRARIMIFRPDGTFRRLLHTGAGGTGERQFIRPESLDIDTDGTVYIADSWANKIIVFDSNLDYAREWPVEAQARGVSVSGGKVFVLDVGKVLVFDTQGKKLASFGKRGHAAGDLDAYQGITAADGKIYVADSYNKRLQQFAEDGKFAWAVPETQTARAVRAMSGQGPDASASEALPDHRWQLPQDLVFDGSGRLVVVDAFGFEAVVVDPETGKAQAAYGDFGRSDGQFYYPTSIDYDPRRDWFAVADTQNNRVQIIRIPGSGNPVLGATWRAVSSPFRYLAIPAILLLIVIVIALVAGRRVLSKPTENAVGGVES